MSIVHRHRSLVALALVAAAATLSACSGASDDALDPSLSATQQAIATGPAPAPIVAQIANAKSQLATLGVPVVLESYTLDGALETDEQADAIVRAMVGATAVVPRFDGKNVGTFSTNTVGERVKVEKAETAEATALAAADSAPVADTEGTVDGIEVASGQPPLARDIVGNIRATVTPLVTKGKSTATLTWRNPDGTRFTSTCVYDANGVVYDNMLSNIVLFEDQSANEARPTKIKLPTGPIVPPPRAPGSEPGIELPDPSFQGLAEAAAARQYHFQVRAFDSTIKWVWGGTRGKITVDHAILWNGSNKIIDQSYALDAWMSVGSAQVKAKETVFKPASYAKIAYGYAWATPTADFSISFDAKKGEVGGSFKVSLKGVGSKGGGDRHHTIYLP
jgi:hypothetical protein